MAVIISLLMAEGNMYYPKKIYWMRDSFIYIVVSMPCVFAGEYTEKMKQD